MNRVMIDIETLGTTPDSVILSVGVYDGEHSWYHTIDLQSCLDAGLKISGSTFEWWMHQSAEARTQLVKGADTLTLKGALISIDEFFSTHLHGDTEIWCCGAAFDVPILENAFRAVCVSVPWKFYMVRCYRTYRELMKQLVPEFRMPSRVGTFHNALDDAKYQYDAMSLMTSALKDKLDTKYASQTA